MRAFKTEGIIIKRKNIGEADRIITIITPDLGKINIKATGVRRIISRRSPHVELLNYTSLGLYKGKFLPILTEAKTIDSFSTLKKDLHKIGLVYHLCELINGLCPENQENKAVFELFKDTLHRLSGSSVILSEAKNPCLPAGKALQGEERSFVNTRDDIVSIIHEFEVELLSLLGYWNNTSVERLWDTQAYIEEIMERKLKSKNIFLKLQ